MRKLLVALLMSIAPTLAACGAPEPTPTTVTPPSLTATPTSPASTAALTPTAAPEQPPSTVAPTATATATPVPPTPTAPPAAIFQPGVEVVASNLEVPWALAFAPDDRLFFTERPGRVRVMVEGQLRREPVAELPVAAVGEAGLMGLALDPDFASNGYLYVMYTYRADGGLRNRISRLTLRGDRAGDEVVLLDGIPGAGIHDGGRLKFGPDGKLYATTGDAANGELAQRLDSLAGKVLRLNPDGSVPNDNPFPGSPVYSYGHRNPQGLAWQPATGALFITEHGPSGEMGLCCRDEINLIEPGANYGWPLVTEAPGDPRFVDPVLHSGLDTWAPAGAAFYGNGEALAPWRGNLFFGALRGQHLHRLVLGGPQLQQVVAEERLFEGEYGRIRDIVLGPDGYLYFTTSNRDGRGRPAPDDDRILRIVPGS
ncbi:MAG: PQQ-dependent sugar dehydrogenase [Anaerolineae bacterium]